MTGTNQAGNTGSSPKPAGKHEFSKDKLPLKINMSWCKACNICIAMCPKQVFEPNRDGKPIQARPEDCTLCTICWVHCPDFAITTEYK